MTEPGRTIDLSVEVPGTPEEVWETIATGPGIGSWFTPMTIEERVGGEVVMDFGDYGTDTATVTAWESPRRVVFQGGGDRPLAYEWLVEARDGHTCVVRLVNTGFGSGEDWDADYDGMTGGWTVFLQHLRLQLTHFRGRRARALIPTATVPGPLSAAWSTLCAALGVPADLAPGDRFEPTGDGVPELAATVEAMLDQPRLRAALLRLHSPAEGTGFLLAEGSGEEVSASTYLYFYGPGGDDWARWLPSRFAPVRDGAGPA